MLVERDDGDGPKEVDVYELSVDQPDMRGIRNYAVINNASDEPIWDVIVSAPIFVEKSKGSDELQSAHSEDEVVSVGPHETLRLPITALTIPYNRLPLKLDFRDNAGRDWSRDDRGRLHRGRTSEPEWAWVDEAAKREPDQKRSRSPISPCGSSARCDMSTEQGKGSDGLLSRLNRYVQRTSSRGIPLRHVTLSDQGRSGWLLQDPATD